MFQQNRNKPIPKPIKWLAGISIIVAVVVTIVLNILYYRQLFEQGLNFVYQYQNTGQNGFVTVVYNLITLLGFGILILILLVLTFVILRRKINAITYITLIMFTAYLVGIGEITFQSTRPFWASTQIKKLQWYCYTQFGNPSGHCTVSVSLYEPLITDMIGSGPFQIGLILPILTGVFICLSRLYLGQHSTNQVMLGLVFSTILLTLYRYFLLKKLYQLIWRMMQPGKIIIFVVMVILNIALFMIPLAVFIHNINNRPFPQLYVDNHNNACGTDHTVLDLETDSLLSSAVHGVFFGFGYGILLLNFDINGDTKYGQYLTGKWYYGSFGNILKKIFLWIVITVIPAAVLLGLSMAVIKNSYAQYVCTTVGYTWIGISLIGFVPIIAFKWGIIHGQTEESPNSKTNNNRRNPEGTSNNPAALNNLGSEQYFQRTTLNM